MIRILAIAPLVIAGFIVYVILFWVLPMAVADYNNDNTKWAVAVCHFIALLIVWLTWGVKYLEVF